AAPEGSPVSGETSSPNGPLGHWRRRLAGEKQMPVVPGSGVQAPGRGFPQCTTECSVTEPSSRELNILERPHLHKLTQQHIQARHSTLRPLPPNVPFREVP